MSAKKLKTSLLSFGEFGQPSISQQQGLQLRLAPPQNSPRYTAFFGAVFNSLDSYFREVYAQGYSQELYATKEHIVGKQFSFLILVNDAPNDQEATPNIAAQLFIEDLLNIARDNEFHHVSHGYQYTPERKEHLHCITLDSPLELMELMEYLLKQYDLNDHSCLSLRFANTNQSSGLSFALFPQYSIEHIRALLYHAQGRNPEGYGLQLSH